MIVRERERESGVDADVQYNKSHNKFDVIRSNSSSFFPSLSVYLVKLTVVSAASFFLSF